MFLRFVMPFALMFGSTAAYADDFLPAFVQSHLYANGVTEDFTTPGVHQNTSEGSSLAFSITQIFTPALPPNFGPTFQIANQVLNGEMTASSDTLLSFSFKFVSPTTQSLSVALNYNSTFNATREGTSYGLSTFRILDVALGDNVAALTPIDGRPTNGGIVGTLLADITTNSVYRFFGSTGVSNTLKEPGSGFVTVGLSILGFSILSGDTREVSFVSNFDQVSAVNNAPAPLPGAGFLSFLLLGMRRARHSITRLVTVASNRLVALQS